RHVRTIRSAASKRPLRGPSALVDCDQVRVQSERGLPQARFAFYDLELLQHVRPDDEGARRAVDREQGMVRADRLDGDGRSHGPALPPSADALLAPLPRRSLAADRLRSYRRDARPRAPLG